MEEPEDQDCMLEYMVEAAARTKRAPNWSSDQANTLKGINQTTFKFRLLQSNIR